MKSTKEAYKEYKYNDKSQQEIDKFYIVHKNGHIWLTKYALHCGYLDVHHVKNGTFYIEHDGGSVYHVKSYSTDNVSGKRIWQVFDTLSAARRYIYSNMIIK